MSLLNGLQIDLKLSYPLIEGGDDAIKLAELVEHEFLLLVDQGELVSQLLDFWLVWLFRVTTRDTVRRRELRHFWGWLCVFENHCVFFHLAGPQNGFILFVDLGTFLLFQSLKSFVPLLVLTVVLDAWFESIFVIWLLVTDLVNVGRGDDYLFLKLVSTQPCYLRGFLRLILFNQLRIKVPAGPFFLVLWWRCCFSPLRFAWVALSRFKLRRLSEVFNLFGGKFLLLFEGQSLVLEVGLFYALLVGLFSFLLPLI